MAVTLETVESWGPCTAFPHDRLVELFDGRETVTAGDVLAMSIDDDQKLWCILRPELIDDAVLVLIKESFLDLIDPENVYYDTVVSTELVPAIGKIMRALYPQPFADTAAALLSIVEGQL